MMNKQKGNMYGFVTHTWNPIRGECSHDCKYCYMKVWKQKPLRFDEKDSAIELGSGNFIFVGSSTDMFADNVPAHWIKSILSWCRLYKGNKYLFQTKNPKRFEEFKGQYPLNSVYGITLESNKYSSEMSNSPIPYKRFEAMCIFQTYDFVKDTMVTIEPIMEFDLDVMIKWINNIKPKWVNIGADSKGHKLPEPSEEKITALIEELGKITEVKLKDNLKRLGDFTKMNSGLKKDRNP